MIKTPVVTALNTSTFVPITSAELCPYGFSVWVEDETGYTYSTTAAGTVSVDMVERGGMSFRDQVKEGEVVMYVKAAAGTPNFIFQPGRRGY